MKTRKLIVGLILFLIIISFNNCQEASVKYYLSEIVKKDGLQKSAKLVVCNDGTSKMYVSYNQSLDPNIYIQEHGCGSSCASLILRSSGNNYKPIQVHKDLEFNYLRSYYNNSYPLALRGISTILHKKGIECSYYKKVSEDKLYNWLKQGKPAIVLLTKNKKYFSKNYIGGKHFVVLVGARTVNGVKKVMIADSSKNVERFHEEKYSDLRKVMVQNTSSKTINYYNYKKYDAESAGGVLLIDY
jgi:hypothetical protein